MSQLCKLDWGGCCCPSQLLCNKSRLKKKKSFLRTVGGLSLLQVHCCAELVQDLGRGAPAWSWGFSSARCALSGCLWDMRIAPSGADSSRWLHVLLTCRAFSKLGPGLFKSQCHRWGRGFICPVSREPTAQLARRNTGPQPHGASHAPVA